MAVTDDEQLYDRLMGYHDTAACWRPDRFGLPRYKDEVFCGVNYRMSELTGAVMLAQLGRLDSLLERMRKNKKRIKDQIKDIKGLDFREVPDEAGDTSVCLIFYLPDTDQTKEFVKGLRKEGINASGIYDSSIPDWHIYAHWKHIMDRVSPTPEGCPWTCPYHKGPEVKYSPDMCPHTLHWLSRSVHIDIPPQMSNEECDIIADSIQKVAEEVLC